MLSVKTGNGIKMDYLGIPGKAMVSFPDASRLGFQHYLDFRSRSTRAEYWWWWLFSVLAVVILSTADIMTGTYSM